MAELFPVLVGLFSGALLIRVLSGRRIGALVLLAAIAIGVSATVLSGEWLQSWEFLLVDVTEALAAALVGAMLGRQSLRGVPMAPGTVRRRRSLTPGPPSGARFRWRP